MLSASFAALLCAAPVTSVAGTAEGAREDAGAVLGHVARAGQQQLAAISPLG